ncbi:vif protein [Simian immunodeficiency virus]|uniref:Vif protein n=1 Tax=Simian immunodeficiency virus TaxID=11723 RepID=Q6VG39_SIV|nr:vif protein [Simian immunodeficiency virus]
MAPRKMWVVTPTNIISESKMDWLIRCTKWHILTGSAPFVYVHHYQLHNQRFSQNKIKLPLDLGITQEGESWATYLEITIYWDLTNVGPSALSPTVYNKQAYTIEWVYWMQKVERVPLDPVWNPNPRDREVRTWYATHLTPDLANQIVHTHYFACFQQLDVRRAIRGEKLLGQCQHLATHYPKVGTPLTLEKLAFLALVRYGATPTKSSAPLDLPDGSHRKTGPTGRHLGAKRRSPKTLLKGRAPWHLGTGNGAAC